ncbi:unnamed protein product [Nezara viridula]|uniref:Uncharacterized protein n=1 Tax=Nezara viridula TaxID=85310 RepID=A0A9P0MF74_NEZVI|nr:unnamed protein product [Nezara viridula]
MRSLSVHQGELVHQRLVNTTMPGLKPMNGSTITMGAVNRHQAGVYQCQANNGVGRSAFRDVTLRVLCKYAPV